MGKRGGIEFFLLLFFYFCCPALVSGTAAVPPLSESTAEEAEVEEDSKRMEHLLAELTRLATKQLLRDTYHRQLPHTAAEARWLGNALHRMMQQERQERQERGLRMSMGVGVDIEGRADLKNASAFVWTPERGRQGLLNATTLLYQAAAKKRDGEVPVLDARSMEEKAYKEEARILQGRSFSERRLLEKRSPKGGMGGGGRGASGARGGGGGGGGGRMSGGGFRGRGSSSASVFSASSAAGMGRVQPIWTIYAGGTVKSGRTASDAVDEDAYKVLNSNETRVEVWICYGPHNGNESCSSKVDLLMEKIQIQRDERSFFEDILNILGWLIIAFILFIVLALCSALLLLIEQCIKEESCSCSFSAASRRNNSYNPASRCPRAPRASSAPSTSLSQQPWRQHPWPLVEAAPHERIEIHSTPPPPSRPQ